MKNKNVIIILFVVVVILLLCYLLISINRTKESSKDETTNIIDDNITNEEKNIDISYLQALEIASSLYGDQDNKVEVTEEDSKYIIYVYSSSSNNLVNTFYMDKQTGNIYDIGTAPVSESTNS